MSKNLHNFVENVDKELYGGHVGSIKTTTRRKEVLGDPWCYAMLGFMVRRGAIEEKILKGMTGLNNTEVNQAMKPLLETNLVARIPESEDRTYFRVTMLGKMEFPIE